MKTYKLPAFLLSLFLIAFVSINIIRVEVHEKKRTYVKLRSSISERFYDTADSICQRAIKDRTLPQIDSIFMGDTALNFCKLGIAKAISEDKRTLFSIKG